jgi:hypothetical protein
MVPNPRHAVQWPQTRRSRKVAAFGRGQFLFIFKPPRAGCLVNAGSDLYVAPVSREMALMNRLKSRQSGREGARYLHLSYVDGVFEEHQPRVVFISARRG